MIKFIYSDTGEPINDFKAEAFVQELIERNEVHDIVEVNVSTEVALTAMVLAIMERKIQPEQVQLFYFDHPMVFNYFIGLDVVDGVSEIGVNNIMVDKILKLGYEKMKARRAANKSTSQ